MAQVAEVTEIDAEFEGDVFAPHFDGSWKEVARESHRSGTGIAFSFVSYHHTHPGRPAPASTTEQGRRE